MKRLLIFALLFFSFYDLFCQVSWQFKNATSLTLLSDSLAEESVPIFSTNQNSLFFVRTGHPQNKGGQDIWISELKDKVFQPPHLLSPPINSAENEYIAGVFEDGFLMVRSMILAGKKTNRLYIVEKDEINYSSPKQLDFPQIATSGAYSGFFIPLNNEKVIVSLKLNNSKSEDLYLLSRDQMGVWQNPLSLGDSINTDGFEISPFLLSDNRTLFFASNGRSESEGSDIYFSLRKGNDWQQWTRPQKVEGVNSPSFDAYFSYDEKGERAFWVSNHARKNADIFTGALVKAKQDVNSLKEDISSKPMAGYDELPEFLRETSIPKKSGDAHVYFPIASSELGADMKKLLVMIASQLKNSKQVAIRLQGYADDLGSEEYNLKLSAERAEAVKNYLVRLGIAPEKFSIEPMGEVALDKNQLKMQRELNRRVDIVVNQ